MNINPNASKLTETDLPARSLLKPNHLRLDKLPLELILKCLEQLNPADLMRLCLVNKQFKALACDPQLKKTVMARINILFRDLIYSPTLQLGKYFGESICKRLENLKVWFKEIKVEDDFVKFSSVSDLISKNDNKCYVFKTLIEGDFALLCIPENRFSTKIIRFNRHFDHGLLNQNDMITWTYSMGQTIRFYIRPDDKGKKAEVELGMGITKDEIVGLLDELILIK